MLQIRHYLCFLLLCFFCSVIEGQKGTCMSGDCINGYGHFEWPGGEKYLGNFVQGKMNGYGVFYWKNNNKFIGYWKDGKMHGEGLLFYDEGIIKKGIWDNNNFIKLVRNDFVLSEKNILHGNTELKKIVRDRPEMKSIVNNEDIIWQWVAHKFAGEDVQSLIYWQKKNYQVYISEEAKELKLMYINAGTRGLLVGLSPQDLSSAIQGKWASLI